MAPGRNASLKHIRRWRPLKLQASQIMTVCKSQCGISWEYSLSWKVITIVYWYLIVLSTVNIIRMFVHKWILIISTITSLHLVIVASMAPPRSPSLALRHPSCTWLKLLKRNISASLSDVPNGWRETDWFQHYRFLLYSCYLWMVAESEMPRYNQGKPFLVAPLPHPHPPTSTTSGRPSTKAHSKMVKSCVPAFGGFFSPLDNASRETFGLQKCPTTSKKNVLADVGWVAESSITFTKNLAEIRKLGHLDGSTVQKGK